MMINKNFSTTSIIFISLSKIQKGYLISLICYSLIVYNMKKINSYQINGNKFCF